MKQYEEAFDDYYVSVWQHDEGYSSDQLLLQGYPFSIELPFSTGDTWLELGVGSGRVVDYHKDKLSDIKCIGFDWSPSAIVSLKKTLPIDIDAMVADVKNMPFQEESFEVITLFGTIQAYEKPEWIPAIKQLTRYLKPDGWIGFSVHPVSGLELVRNLKAPQYLKNMVTETYLEKELNKHGLEGRYRIERHHAYTIIQKITRLFGIKLVHWYGFIEYEDTKATRRISSLFRKLFPFLTFGHYWVWIQK